MEALDASFACLFMGWGNRPGLETNDMHRTERDKDFGESIIESVEDFMINNVEAGIMPSLKVVTPELRRKNIKEMYGEAPATAQPVDLDKSLLPTAQAIEKKQKALDEAEDELKKAKEKVEEIKAQIDDLEIPFIEDLAKKGSNRGILKDGKKVFDIRKSTRNAFDAEEFAKKHPEKYETVKKVAVYTDEVKAKYPEEYKACSKPKAGKDEKYNISIYETRR